jgi:multidrug efflux pump subunit AcrA (membrane-fusion protein)
MNFPPDSKINLPLLVVLVCLAASLTGCSKKDADDAGNSPEKADAAPKAGVTLDAETQKKLGLAMANPTSSEWRTEITAYGRVLDPIPLNDLLADLSRAELSFDLARQEWERSQKLQPQHNISTKAYQEAESTYQQNLSEVSTARRKIESAWGRKIAEMTGPIELSSADQRQRDPFLTQLGDSVALIRIDLPVRIRLSNTTNLVRIVSLAENASSLVGTNLDELPTIDPQTQQLGILVAVPQPATNRLIPGEAVAAYLTDDSTVEQGAAVPASAVLRYEGQGWVYVQADTNQFVRVEVPLNRQTANEYFIGNQISITNQIIVTGAQSVLSAELGGGFTTGNRD